MANVDFEFVPVKEPEFEFVPTNDITTPQPTTKPKAKVEGSLWESFKEGLEGSSTSLQLKSIMGGKYKPPEVEPTSFGGKASSMMGTVLGDLPSYLAFGAAGTLAGGPAGFVTGPATAMGGTELLKADLRSKLGSGETPEQVFEAGGKGAVVGAALGPLSQIAKVPGISNWAAKTALPLEIAGGATVSAGLEGKNVTPEDIALFAVPVAGLKATGHVINVGKTAIEAGPKAERFAERQAVAKKAGIPQTVTTGDIIQPKITPDKISDKIVAPTIAAENRRRRKVVDDLQQKQAEVTKFQDMIQKEKDEVTSKIIIEEPVDDVSRTFVEQRVQELGSAEKVRELYSTNSPVDILARETASRLFEKGGDTNVAKQEVQAKTEVIDETPSVQKLNKAGLSEAEFKQLTDTEVFTPEEIASIRKLPGFKQREQFDRTFETDPIVTYTPESLAKAEAIAQKVDLEAKTRRSAVRDLETLESEGWSKEDIAKMSKSDIERKARVLRGEVNPLNPSKETVEKLTEVEQELRQLNDEIINTPVDKLNPEQDAKIEALIKKVNESGLDEVADSLYKVRYDTDGNLVYDVSPKALRKTALKERVAALKEEGKFNVKRPEVVFEKKPVRRRALPRTEEEVKIEDVEGEGYGEVDYTERASRTRSQEISENRKRLEGSAEDWEAKLELEGMPSELNFAKKQGPLDKVAGVLEKEIFKILTEESEPSRAKVESDIDRAITRKHFVKGDRAARNAMIIASKHIPLTKDLAKVWFDKLGKFDSIIEPFISHKQTAFTLKAISKGVKDNLITREEANIMKTTFSTLKKQPNFTIEVTKDLGVDSEGKSIKASGLYNLAENLIKIKDPKYTAHEVAHWAYYNLLDAADRKVYNQHFMDTYYKQDGALDITKLRKATTDARNAVTSPGELFAAKMSDYMYDKVLTPTEKNLYSKVITWFKELTEKLNKKINKDYSSVEDIFKKVLETEDQRNIWAEEGLPNLIEESPRGVTLDMLGFQSMYERISMITDIFKKAKMDDSGKRILSEIKDQDWGLGAELDARTIFSTDKSTVSQRAYKNLGPHMVSPMTFIKGTRNERHVYNANLAEMYISHMFDQHRTTIDHIELGLKKGNGLKENVRKVIEGTIEGTPAEQVAATEVRQWLDGMKARYKVFQLNEYKDNLNKTEYNALLDIIAGRSIEEVNAKYPKLDTETIKEIADKHKEIDTWGIDNYIPNVEAGRFKVLADGVDADGKAYKKLVAIGLSEKDAVRKATRYLEENPETNKLYVDTDYKTISDDKTKVTRGQYYSMMGSLAKKITESIDGIEKGVAREMAKKALTKKFKIVPTDSYSPFLEPRRDVLKGEDDIFPVLRSYAHSMEKKMALDPVIDIIRNDIPKMDKAEKKYILDFIEDVKGRYGATDQMVDTIFNSYRGYSRLVSRVRTAQATLKLGYRPIAAGINLASGQMHTWVKRGLPIYVEGIKFIKTPEGKQFIKDVEPFLGTSVIDTGTNIKSNAKWYEPLGLFQMPEPYNREVSVAAAYRQAIKPKEKGGEGMTPEAAKIFAIRANWAEQFTYNMANLPKIMRGPTGKLITQFKPYLVKEMEFMSTLSGREWIRYLGMQLALGGPRGYMTVMKSLPILATFGFFQEAMDIAEEWMNKNMPIASRGVAGLPGLIKPEYGMDISAASTFQFPSGASDFAGPALSDLWNLKKNVIDPLTNFGPYAEDLKKTGDIAPIIRHWARLMQFTFTDDNWIKDTNGHKLYEVKDIVPFYLQSIAGVENIDINRIRAEERILAQRDVRTRGTVTRIINQAMDCIINGKPMSDELMARMGKYGVTADSLKRRIKTSELPPDLRILLNTEVIRRPEVLDMFPNSEDYGTLPD